VALEGQVLEGLQIAVVPHHHELVPGQLLHPVDHELGDLLEVATLKIG